MVKKLSLRCLAGLFRHIYGFSHNNCASMAQLLVWHPDTEGMGYRLQFVY